jgi:hypothetical protein
MEIAHKLVVGQSDAENVSYRQVRNLSYALLLLRTTGLIVTRRCRGDGMIALKKSADAYSLRDADVELSFRHVSDRWQHCVSVLCQGGWLPLLTSEEGSPTDERPPSPPWQELRLEQPADEVFEFQLLGQAGKGVYSAAVRFDGGAHMIDFDMCARGRSNEKLLCTVSRYVLPGDPLPQVRELPRALVLHAGGVQAIEMAPVPIADNPRSECRLMTMEHVPRIETGCFGSIGSDISGKGFSIRWRYRMTFAGHP